jgi:hypothetical protein
MYKPEFVALQVSVLIRSDEVRSRDIQVFLDSVEFKADMQEELAGFIQENLRANKVSFDEVIISLDKPPQKAKPAEPGQSSGRKSSGLARLFGKK